MIKPKPLKCGDTVGILSISSCVKDIKQIDTVVEKLKNMGFKVKVGKSSYEKYGYLSGNDLMRADSLNEMFYDNEVDAIVCLRGGFGSIRILDKINYYLIKKNPKIFIGYSDVTAAHIAIGQKANLVTFHGPMLIGEFENGLHELSFQYLKDVLTGNDFVDYSNPPHQIETLVDGVVQGPITGGNLSVLTSTLGTGYEIDTLGKILFIEEIDEDMYRIDSMLSQLKLAGKLESCAGFILGQFTNCPEEDGFTLKELLNDKIVPLGKPTIMNFQAGHTTPNYIFPFGVNTYMDATNRIIKISKSVL